MILRKKQKFKINCHEKAVEFSEKAKDIILEFTKKSVKQENFLLLSLKKKSQKNYQG